jgi:DNA helicase-2/ATP-dependent DNA helicase PcrA
VPSLTLESLFAEAGFTPNPPQLQAISHTEGPLFLVAGPGSGKTRVLLWRTVNLMVFQGVKPEEIFLATFTEKAAKQLRDGLLSLLGLVTNRTGTPYDLSKMYIGTVHSLCNRLLTDRAFSPGRQRSQSPVVMDALEQYFHLYRKRFWRDALAALGVEDELEDVQAQINQVFGNRNSSSRHKAVVGLQSLFNRFSEENLDPHELMAKNTNPELDLPLKLYAHYLSTLGQRVDLSLLQQAAYRTVTTFPDASTLFKHVIVDEYQDTNAIQEKLYFALSGCGNICVVGDDEQALYRFRGATVENFVQFPERCHQYLQLPPTRIALNTNYRSRKGVVDFYTKFMGVVNWQREGGGAYRIEGKDIQAHSSDAAPAVVVSDSGHPEDVSREIAGLIQSLITSGKVQDANQIACLFPSVKNAPAKRLEAALGELGLKVYSPRAKRFLETDEATVMLGLMMQVTGRTPRELEFNGGDYKLYHDWLDLAEKEAKAVIKQDDRLASFLQERKAEIAATLKDYHALRGVLEKQGWALTTPYDPGTHKRALMDAPGLSNRARQGIGNQHFDKVARERQADGKPVTLNYAINRATSLDWTVLDLFYRLTAFQPFKAMFDLAEQGQDEGPVTTLSLVSQLVSRFLEETQTILTASSFDNDLLRNQFSGSYLFALFRLGEGEYEDEEVPFPKGRVPFLTVHQSKGLEFPVVVLGSVRKDDRGPQTVETLVRPFLPEGGEPLEKVSTFDTMRMFYVALSRAQNLLVLAHTKGAGQSTHDSFKVMLAGSVNRIRDLDLSTVPAAKHETDDTSRTYSYTADYLRYLECPRSYMIFRKYDFADSRTGGMFFGNLVHQTIEDLHNRLIAARQGVSA